MWDKIQQKATEYLAKNHRHRTWMKIVSMMACIVVFCTTYALILPAITLEGHKTYCGLKEHLHDEACYEKVLICDLEEAAAEEGSDTEEAAGHVHTDECYEEVLTCEKDEHEHELICHSNPEADLESQDDWLDSVSGVELTGDWSSDLVAVAESQLDYEESKRNYVVGDDGETKKGYTRYGDWYGDTYGDWNAMFVSFCLDYAGIPVETFPQEQEPSIWAELLQGEEFDLYRAKEDYRPKAGDLIFLDSDEDGEIDRVGIISVAEDDAESEAQYITAIEGDADDCVQMGEYMTDEEQVVGYAELPEGTGTEETQYSNLMAAAGEEATAPPVKHTKTIDAFRDGEDNPDTDLDNKADIDKTDLHRLYLDFEMSKERTPVDLIIVVDQSGSMHMDYGNAEQEDQYKDMYYNGDIFRDDAVNLALNGTYRLKENRKETDTYIPGDYDAHKEEGIIYRFLKLHPENHIAVAEFHGIPHEDRWGNGIHQTTDDYYQDKDGVRNYNPDASVLKGWKSRAEWIDNGEDEYIPIRGQERNATNYCAGFIEADKLLNDPKIMNNGHHKVMLFLSDGVPTVYLEKQDGSTGEYVRGGTGQTGTTEEAAKRINQYRQKTMDAFDEFYKKHGIITYGVGISEDITTDDPTGLHSPVTLRHMANKSGGSFIEVKQLEDMEKVITHLMKDTAYWNVAINDTLSKYVDVYGEQPDFKLVMTKPDGTEIVLYDKNGIPEAYKDIVKSVGYDGKKVSAVFQETYKPEMGCKYTLSFNVKTTNEAYDYYESHDNIYPDKGDAYTDYGTNKTSSNQGGFYSNDVATLTYKYENIPGSEEYDMPVVQVADCEVVVEKKWFAYSEEGEPENEITNTKTGEIEFTLYQKAYKYVEDLIDPGTSTVTFSKQRDSRTPEKIPSVPDLTVKNGSTVTLKFTSRIFEGLTVNGQSIPMSQNGSDGYTKSGNNYTYIFTVSGNADICIKYSDGWITSGSPTNCSVTHVDPDPEYAPPRQVWLDPKPYREEPYKLSSDGEEKWKVKIENLPLKRPMEDGTDVYYTYYVDEVSVNGANLDDYVTTYENNGGVTEGTIIIKNKAKNPPRHELPQSGGRGTLPYTIGGLLLTAAGMLLMYINKKRGKEDYASS